MMSVRESDSSREVFNLTADIINEVSKKDYRFNISARLKNETNENAADICADLAHLVLTLVRLQ